MTNLRQSRIGLLLAAGRGGRLGGSKQLIPWPTRGGPKALIATAYDAILPICDHMVVVLGHDADAVSSALAPRSFLTAESSPDAPMSDSIRAGLRVALSINPSASIVLQPGDHPEVDSSTLRILTAAASEHPTQAIIPEHAGRGGHPVLIPPSVAQIILDSDSPSGLGQFWLDHPQLCLRILVEDSSVLRDIDTPADLPAG